MNDRCEIVRDLMPLYIDGVCSETSAAVVEDHIKDCPACRDMLGRMKNDELDRAVYEEKEQVLRNQAGFFKRKSAMVGAVIAGIFMIPILICLIINLATGRGLSWFFIVLFALLVASSLTVVPLMAPDNKGLWTLGTFTSSLIALLAVISLYTRSSFFFVAVPAILFGLALVFLPLVIRAKPVAELPIKYKGFWVMVADTVLFGLVLFTSTLPVTERGFMGRAFSVALPFVAFAWVLFLILYFGRSGKLIKAGICVVLLGGLSFTAEMIVNGILGLAVVMPVFRPSVWTENAIDGNVAWIVFLSSLAVGLILIGIGLLIEKRKKRRAHRIRRRPL